MSGVTLYHNPRCSKSRQALELLRGRGIEPTIVEYLKDPPNLQMLKSLLGMLGMSPRQLMRSKEAAYEDLRLGDPGLNDEDLLRAMSKHPVLIERPIAVKGRQAVLGRPPERVLEIL